MRYQKKDIQVIMSECVQRTATKLLAQLKNANADINSIGFEFGHPKEIIETLQEQTKNPGTPDGNGGMTGGKYDIWPVVFLFADVDGEYGSRFTFPDYRLNMVIAMNTSRTLKALEREEKNFKKILTPIYEQLIREMGAHICLKTQSAKQIKHTATKRYFWGKSDTGNIFNDYIDAIEIKDLQLTIYN